MIKKTKVQYRDAHNSFRFIYKGIDLEFLTYPNMRSGCHKHFSTKQEKSFYIMHQIEYKDYPLRMRSKRSSSSLAEPWDDFPSYVYDKRKSWKHNSKRKNQYYKF